MSEEKCDQLDDFDACYFYLKYDLAILTLRKKVNFKPWPILSRRNLKRGDLINFYGYGIDLSEHCGALKQGYAKVKKYQREKAIVRIENGSDRTCGGDQGGPVVLSNKLQKGIIGIVDGWKTYGCERKNMIHIIPFQDKATLDFIRKEAPRAKIL